MTLKQPNEIQIIVGPTPPGCAAWAACPASPVQETGDPGVPTQQEWGSGSPPQVGTVGTWEEHDMQEQNFKSQHLAMTNPSLPGVSITWMPMCLPAKFVPFWHENPVWFSFSAHLCVQGRECAPWTGELGGWDRKCWLGWWTFVLLMTRQLLHTETLFFYSDTERFLSPLGFYSQRRLLLFLFFCI